MRGVYILILFFLFGSVSGSDLKLGKSVSIVSVANGTAVLETSVSWSNSWCDRYNNDGVWVFFRFRSERSDWEVLLPSGGEVSENGFAAFPGKSDNNITGFFVYRDTIGSGNASVSLRLTWSFPSWITPDMLTEGDISIQAQGVEMVLIPFGRFPLGDGSSSGSFCSLGSTDPLIITSENAVTVSTLNNSGVSSSDLSVAGGVGLYGSGPCPAAYPKGYNGFYCMKYELSQGQYVAFLNGLSRAEQLRLLGSQLETLPKGSFLFDGSGTVSVASASSSRNCIVIRETMTLTRGAVFGCKNASTGAISEDSPLACNFLSPLDLLGYASFSGLRPMSEFEYEKVSRRSTPLSVVPGSFAWGDASFTPLSGLLDADADTERPVSGNVNGGSINTPGGSPARCGAFSTVGRGLSSSGASFSGVMEMSGNVRELVVGVSASSFSGLVHGSGTFNPGRWISLSSALAFGTRGGGFNSPASELAVSDRSQMTGSFTSLSDRRSDVGFRCVRSFDASGVSIDAGAISGGGVQKYCSGTPFSISSNQPACVPGLGGVEISYRWFMDGGEVSGARGASLSFPSGLSNSPSYGDRTYRFTRLAECVIGSVESNTVEITVYGTMGLSVSPLQGAVTSDTSTAFTAKVKNSGEVSFSYIDNTNSDIPGNRHKVSGPHPVGMGDSVTYTPSYIDFNYTTGSYMLICSSVTDSGCRDSITMPLTISVRILAGSLSAPDTVCMGEAFSVTGSASSLVGMPSDKEAAYSWYMDNILLSGHTGRSLSLSGALKGNRSYSFFRRSSVSDGTFVDSESVTIYIRRCVPLKPDGTPYATVMVDTLEWFAENAVTVPVDGNSWDGGVYGLYFDWEGASSACPAGWRLPDNEDWAIWSSVYGSSGLGSKMKSNTSDWSSGGKGTNESGFSGLPGGYYRSATGSITDRNTKGYWWSSTYTGSSPYYFELSSSQSILSRKTLSRTNGASVRCVRQE